MHPNENDSIFSITTEMIKQIKTNKINKNQYMALQIYVMIHFYNLKTKQNYNLKKHLDFLNDNQFSQNSKYLSNFTYVKNILNTNHNQFFFEISRKADKFIF
jgi:hypothetical protein